MSKEITPISFKQANINLTGEGCNALPAYVANQTVFGRQFISCWRIPFWQRVRMLFHGKVWLSVYAFQHPPVALIAETPFIKPPKEKHA